MAVPLVSSKDRRPVLATGRSAHPQKVEHGCGYRSITFFSKDESGLTRRLSHGVKLLATLRCPNKRLASPLHKGLAHYAALFGLRSLYREGPLSNLVGSRLSFARWARIATRAARPLSKPEPTFLVTRNTMFVRPLLLGPHSTSRQHLL